jgi:hypothetical protein
MKYHVATIASVIVGALLIGAASVQSRRAEQQTLALRASLSELNIQQLSSHYWECEPQGPGERYNRNAVYCGEIIRAFEARANEVPTLQIVKITPPYVDLPDNLPQGLIQRITPSKIMAPTPQNVMPEPSPTPVSASL